MLSRYYLLSNGEIEIKRRFALRRWNQSANALVREKGTIQNVPPYEYLRGKSTLVLLSDGYRI